MHATVHRDVRSDHACRRQLYACARIVAQIYADADCCLRNVVGCSDRYDVGTVRAQSWERMRHASVTRAFVCMRRGCLVSVVAALSDMPVRMLAGVYGRQYARLGDMLYAICSVYRAERRQLARLVGACRGSRVCMSDSLAEICVDICMRKYGLRMRAGACMLAVVSVVLLRAVGPAVMTAVELRMRSGVASACMRDVDMRLCVVVCDATESTMRTTTSGGTLCDACWADLYGMDWRSLSWSSRARISSPVDSDARGSVQRHARVVAYGGCGCMSCRMLICADARQIVMHALVRSYVRSGMRCALAVCMYACS